MVVQKGGDLFLRERLLRDQLWIIGIMNAQVMEVQVNLNFSHDVCTNIRTRKKDFYISTNF